MTSQEIEIAVADHFCYRQNVIVPNVSFGFLNYEADLLIMKPSGYLFEVEIKTSAADIRADRKKRHHHNSVFTKALYFAIPEKLIKSIEHIPERAGILLLSDHYTSGNREALCRVHVKKLLRAPTLNKSAKPLDQEHKIKLLRLAAMRTWTLKKALANATWLKRGISGMY